MIELLIWFIVGFLIAYYAGEWSRGVKLHKHNWDFNFTHTTQSFYSSNKVNVHSIYRCSDPKCNGFKVRTHTVKKT